MEPASVGYRSSEPSSSPRLPQLLALVAVVVGLSLFVHFGGPGALTLTNLRGAVEAAGVWGPIVYGLVAVGAALLLVPSSVIIAVAALLFPLVFALPLAWAGAFGGACAAFVVARAVGRRRVERWLGARLALLDRSVEAHGFRVVLLLRLVGLPPTNVFNYAAGLTRLRFVDYAAASALGLLPLVVVVTVLVNRLGRTPSWQEIARDPILYAVAFGIMALAYVALRFRRSAEGLVKPGETEGQAKL